MTQEATPNPGYPPWLTPPQPATWMPPWRVWPPAPASQPPQRKEEDKESDNG